MEENRISNKVGILTLPYDANYGWILQHYALIKFLESNGYNPISIQRKWNKQNNRSIIYYIKKWVYYNVLTRNFNIFYKTYINPKTEIFNTPESIKKINKYNFNSIIVGSDQVWRTEFTDGVGDNYFLDFVNSSEINKIAYAASFGNNQWKNDELTTLRIKSLLEDFKYISVREDSGIEICKNVFNLKVESLVDPTLLLTQVDYNNLIGDNAKLYKKPTLITYILDSNKDKEAIIGMIAKDLELNICNLFPKKKRKWNCYISVKKWLRSYRDSDFVVTDSFHGTVFSIIFNKPFVTIANRERGLARFTSLLDKFGLSNRLIYSFDKEILNNIIKETIDFQSINNHVKTNVNISKRKLDENLNCDN